MSKMEVKPQSAWLPLTPAGVAAFAHANTRRLLLVQFVAALLVAASVGWFLYYACFPTVIAAIETLPTSGEIRSSKLDWHGASPQMLAEGSFLALTVDTDHTGGLRSAADVQVEFGRADFRVRSLFGMIQSRYPEGWVIEFNRKELKPRFGAWEPALTAGAMAGVLIYLMLSWWLLAAVYAPIMVMAGAFVGRELDFARSWRLAGAALMPGAVIMAAAFLAYGIGLMNLLGFMFAFAAHLVAGWAYLFLSLLFVPGAGVARKKNPFAPERRK